MACLNSARVRTVALLEVEYVSNSLRQPSPDPFVTNDLHYPTTTVCDDDDDNNNNSDNNNKIDCRARLTHRSQIFAVNHSTRNRLTRTSRASTLVRIKPVFPFPRDGCLPLAPAVGAAQRWDCELIDTQFLVNTKGTS